MANYGGGTISVIGRSTNAVIKTIDLHDDAAMDMWMPHNVQAMPNGRQVWATAMSMDNNNAIFVIDSKTDNVIKQIHVGVGFGLAHVVFDAGSQRAYVTAYNTSQILVFDAGTFEPIDIINLGSGHAPHGLRYSNGKLYVANFVGMSLSIMDVADNELTEIALGGMVTQTAVTPDGKFVFASVQSEKKIARLNLENDSLTFIGLPPDAKGPVQIYPSPDSKHIYVCDQGEMTMSLCSNKLYVINVESGLVDNAVTTGNAAHGVVLSRDGKFAYVTNALDNTMSIVNTSTLTAVATIHVGDKPNGISYLDEIGGMP